MANDEKVQTEPQQQDTVIEQYTKLQNACKESINGPSDDVNSTLKMVDDKEQDQVSRLAEGRGEEAIMLDQLQESQQDKEVSQSQTEANMRQIVNDMEHNTQLLRMFTQSRRSQPKQQKMQITKKNFWLIFW